jgi:mRNA interferase MazF
MSIAMLRGEIYEVDLDPVVGSEQGKKRPCVIIQNDFGNACSPVTIVACITSKLERKNYPTNVFITAQETGLRYDSLVLLNQIRTVDKARLTIKKGKIPPLKMLEIDAALKISLDFI